MMINDYMRNLALSPLWVRLCFTVLYAFGLVAVPVIVGLHYGPTAQAVASGVFWLALLLTWAPLNAAVYWPLSARVGMLALALVFFSSVAGGYALVGALALATYAIGGGQWNKE